MTARYLRYVALGDSQTEGLNDPYPDGSLRGWADRLAEDLAATTSPDLRYANLGVRGCRAAHVRYQQLPAALELRPDLATVVVGMNDVLRHDYDLDRTVDDVEQTVSALVAAGAEVCTMTFPNIGRMLPLMSWLLPRQRRLHERLAEVSERHGVRVLDLFPLAMNADPRMWSHDRIHGSSEGHRRIAAGMAELLGLPASDGAWRDPMPGASRAGLLDVVRRDAHWAATFLVPFLTRQLKGHGPTEDRVAKRPDLAPITRGAVS